MVHHRREPAAGAVTGVTANAGLDVPARFTRGQRTVMTGGAGAGHFIVLDIGWRPAIDGMTRLTIATGKNVRGRFARGNTAVMTSGARPGYGSMIDVGRIPGSSDMAIIARAETLDMTTWFA